MKRISALTLICFFILLTPFSLIAQTVVEVDQGLGTLELAIDTHGGDVVYKLQAGGRYGLTGILEVNESTLGGPGKTLTIVGEETEEMPAVIQVGVEADGGTCQSMFRIWANLTLKNVFLADQDYMGTPGVEVITLEAPVKLILDNCVIDPAGVNRTFGGRNDADGSRLFLSNSLLLNNGHMQGPNDGGYTGSMQWDTMWVENNTFVSSGQDFIGTTFHSTPNNHFIWINHNTFMWHDVWIKKSYNDQNFYFTNNLMHDISIFAHIYSWGQFFPDFGKNHRMLSLSCIDTLMVDDQGTLETLPSQRKVFWEYNLQYSSPQLRSVPKHAADEGYPPLYLIPMLWDENVPLDYTGGIPVVSPADSSRENRILADDANWPYMKYKHNWYDKDPLYNNPQIYSTNDSMIQNIKSWYGDIMWDDGSNFTGNPSYLWSMDKWAGTDPSSFPDVWPRFDGSYHNPELLSASIEGLPLGDLNWFPAQKVEWLSKQKQIEEHILSLQESPYGSDPDSLEYEIKLSIQDEAYNPIEGALLIIEGDSIGSTDKLGRIRFDTLIGNYPYVLSADGFRDTTGIIELTYGGYSGTVILDLIEYELSFGIFETEEGVEIPIEGASIEVDGRPGQLLSSQLGWVSFDTVGPINYSVSKAGFLPEYGQIDVSETDTVRVEMEPIRQMDFLVKGFKDRVLEGARIYIASQTLYSDHSGRATIVLPDGEYSYMAAADQHRSSTDKLIVNKESEEGIIQIILEPLAYTVSFLITDGIDPVKDAQVLVSGERLISNDHGTASTLLLDGNYEYNAFAPNTDTVFGTVTVKGDAVIETILLTVISSREHLDASGISVYPNPASDVLTMEIPGSEVYTLQVINIMGSICKELTIRSSPANVRLEDLEEGVFVLRLFNQEKEYNVRIRIER